MANALQLIGGNAPRGLESLMKVRKVTRITDIARNENSMKKLILLALTAVMMAGCTGCEGHDNAEHLSRQGIYSYISVVIDSCEYVMNSGVSRMSHKGNCKFCAERRKKELEELIMKIKEE